MIIFSKDEMEYFDTISISSGMFTILLLFPSFHFQRNYGTYSTFSRIQRYTLRTRTAPDISLVYCYGSDTQITPPVSITGLTIQQVIRQ